MVDRVNHVPFAQPASVAWAPPLNARDRHVAIFELEVEVEEHVWVQLLNANLEHALFIHKQSLRRLLDAFSAHATSRIMVELLDQARFAHKVSAWLQRHASTRRNAAETDWTGEETWPLLFSRRRHQLVLEFVPKHAIHSLHKFV